MLARRAAVNAVVAKIKKERADSGGDTWNTHTDINKFVKAVEDREDLRKMLKAEGARIDDMRSRLQRLRQQNEVDYFLKFNEY